MWSGIDQANLAGSTKYSAKQPGSITATWSQVSALGQATWVDRNKPQAQVRFDKRGHYLLKLTVDNGTFSADEELLIAVAARTTDSLLALYTLEEGSGQTVADVSGNGQSLDLKVLDPAGVNWVNGGLHLHKAPASLVSQEPATKLTDAIRSSGEVTVEAWIRPDNQGESGLARIVSLSGGPTTRNFTVGQRDAHYHAAFRTTKTNANASNQALAGGAVSAGDMTHLVCTRDATGLTKMTVNGVQVSGRIISGDLESWDGDFVLALGNELQSNDVHDRAWQGTYHLVAIYNRALTHDEIERIYAFGADTNLPPLVNAGPDQVINWPDEEGLPISTQLGGIITHDRPTRQMNAIWSQVGGPGSPGGVRFDDELEPATTAHFQRFGRYVLRLTADDGELMSSDEVAVVVNQPPQVSAGPDQRIGLDAEFQLTGTLTDDGLGDPKRGKLTLRWDTASGPSEAKLENPDRLQTRATFQHKGSYLLRLTADNGYLAGQDETRVVVDQQPQIDAGADQAIRRRRAQLAGVVIDDGLGDPATGDLTISWEQVGGPRRVRFEEPDELGSNARFSRNGTYRLRLTVDNGTYSTADDVIVEVRREDDDDDDDDD